LVTDDGEELHCARWRVGLAGSRGWARRFCPPPLRIGRVAVRERDGSKFQNDVRRKGGEDGEGDAAADDGDCEEGGAVDGAPQRAPRIRAGGEDGVGCLF
jgi:hypothetical protein